VEWRGRVIALRVVASPTKKKVQEDETGADLQEKAITLKLRGTAAFCRVIFSA
jgi:hypothetical protein